MSKSSAVCLRCGNFKARALGNCTNCGFAPITPEEKARSLILSPHFDAGEEVVGLSRSELEVAAKEIQGGKSFAFDPAAVSRVAAQHELASAITPRRLAIDLARWLGPPVALLVGAYWLLWRK